MVAGGQTNMIEQVPRQVIYRVKVANSKGLIRSPLVRTLDNEKATVNFQASGKQSCEINMTPHVSPSGALSSSLDFKVGGARRLPQLWRLRTHFRPSRTSKCRRKFRAE